MSILWQNHNKAKLPQSRLSLVDSRIKLIFLLIYLITVTSFSTNQLSQIIPLLIIPTLWFLFSNLSFAKLLFRLLLLSPFVFFIGIFNLYFQPTVVITLFDIAITEGMISFITIIIKFILSISLIILWVDSDGIMRICNALQKIGVPKVFTTQLFLLYRYIFVLAEIISSRLLAYNLRVKVKGKNSNRVSVFLSGSMLGSILLQLISRAQIIHQAMLARGFSGEFVRLAETEMCNLTTIVILFLLSLFVISCAFINYPQIFGNFFLSISQ